MAKAASKYISFDTAGNFVSEFEDGSAAPEAPEDGSLKSAAVSYTHLDVYKRQIHSPAPEAGAEALS